MLFSKIAKFAPTAMAEESFKETNCVLASKGQQPVSWNEFAAGGIVFLSGYLLEFIQLGKMLKAFPTVSNLTI